MASSSLLWRYVLTVWMVVTGFAALFMTPAAPFFHHAGPSSFLIVAETGAASTPPQGETWKTPYSNSSLEMAEYHLFPSHAASSARTWNVEQVEAWMKENVGYPELVTAVKKHMIDGLTLLSMDLEELKEYFPFSSSLHLVKLRAHLTEIQDTFHCIPKKEWKGWEDWKRAGGGEAFHAGCPEGQACCPAEGKDTTSWSLWQQLYYHPKRTFFLGVSSTHFSRFTMLWAYFYYPEVYYFFIGKETEKAIPEGEPLSLHSDSSSASSGGTFWMGSLRKLLFWIAFFVAPDVYLSIHALWCIRSSYIVMPVLAVFLLLQNAIEVHMLYKAIQERPFRLQHLFSHILGVELMIPFIAFLLSYLPWVVLVIVVVIFTVYLLLLSVGVAAELLEQYTKTKDPKNATTPTNVTPAASNTTTTPSSTHQDTEGPGAIPMPPSPSSPDANREHRSTEKKTQ